MPPQVATSNCLPVLPSSGFGVALDRQPPDLVVGEVEVQDVALVEGDKIDQLEDKCSGHEVPAHVQVHTAPCEPRGVDHVQARHSYRAGPARPPEDLVRK
jgi:hypothetical protein